MQALHTPALHPSDTVTINVGHKIGIDSLIGLVNMAYEGPIDYWVDEFVSRKRSKIDSSDDFEYVYQFVIKDPRGSEHLISVNTIIDGIHKIMTGTTGVHSSYLSYIASDLGQGLQGGYIDDETIDVIVQVGLFGEVVYG